MAQHAESSVEEILTDYENYARTVLNRDDTTLNQHRRYIGRLLRHAEEPPHAITETDIIAYLESEQPMSDSKKNNILSTLRVFFDEYLDRDIADEFEMPTTGPSPTHVPAKDELQTFYAAIERPKYRTIFLMYATSGLRSAELLEPTMEDINKDMRILVPDKQSDVKKDGCPSTDEQGECLGA
jgi:integrase